MTEQAKKSSLERTFEFTVSDAELQKETARRLKERAKNARVDGFRRGKVPMQMVRQMYGAQVYMDALNNLVGVAYGKAAQASGLQIVGAPSIEPKGEIKDGVDPEFVATVEVMPEVKVPDFSATELKRYTCEVTDEDVAKTIAVMQKQRATYEEEPEGVAANDKRVTIDFTGTENGVAFQGGTAKDFAFVLGVGQMLPDFEAAILGMKAGEEKTFEMTFPEDYVKELAGHKVSFAISLKKVELAKLPAVDEEFAKKLGIKDVAKLNEEVKANLSREVKFRLTARTKEGVMSALNDMAGFDLPKAMVEDEKASLEQGFKDRMAIYGGAKDGEIAVPDMTESAKRRVRIGLMINAIVRENKLSPTDEEITAHIDDMVATYEEPAKVKEWFMKDRVRMSEATAHVLETKVMDFVLSKAKTTEEPVAFDSVMAG